MTDTAEVQFKKGALELCVLAMLRREDRYAYDLASQLARAIGMSDGTIYPLMRRLQIEGLVEAYFIESASGPPRKYYRLTSPGLSRLQAQAAAWRSFTASVEQILGDLA